MNDITNIYQVKTGVKYDLSDYLGAVLMALAIGVPFAIYFWKM
jgi:hypothetical protein